MIRDSKCRICRRAGEKLFLKGDKCFTPKCIFVKKPYPPGKLQAERKHRSNMTDYGIQLREKQKVRNIYGISERQFSKYVEEAMTKKSSSVNVLYEILESRLDNVVFRLGLASSRGMSRQLVSHGHITVNGRRVTIASYRVSPGDVLAIRSGSTTKAVFGNLTEKLKKYPYPAWIKFDLETNKGEIVAKPKEEKATMPFNLDSVIEFYSR